MHINYLNPQYISPFCEIIKQITADYKNQNRGNSWLPLLFSLTLQKLPNYSGVSIFVILRALGVNLDYHFTKRQKEITFIHQFLGKR